MNKLANVFSVLKCIRVSFMNDICVIEFEREREKKNAEKIKKKEFREKRGSKKKDKKFSMNKILFDLNKKKISNKKKDKKQLVKRVLLNYSRTHNHKVN